MGDTNFLKGARVYLSGPMDFVSSREKEKKYGWRNRIGKYLHEHGATVFDPWNKPDVKNLHEYGKEDDKSIEFRETWDFLDNLEGAHARGECASAFWETLHIDLRMVDICDFVIAYCPTNIYSVGTPHEISLARQQRKPVLFVSPPVTHTALSDLSRHLEGDDKGLELLQKLISQVPIKENIKGIPSLWYMPLVGAHNFFDGFGFGHDDFESYFSWVESDELDPNEKSRSYSRPLLTFLESLTKGVPPTRWDHDLQTMVKDDDWLLLNSVLKIEE